MLLTLDVILSHMYLDSLHHPKNSASTRGLRDSNSSFPDLGSSRGHSSSWQSSHRSTSTRSLVLQTQNMSQGLLQSIVLLICHRAVLCTGAFWLYHTVLTVKPAITASSSRRRRRKSCRYTDMFSLSAFIWGTNSCLFIHLAVIR